MRIGRVPLLDAAIAAALVGWGLLELIARNAWAAGPHGVQVAGVIVACASVALRRISPMAAVGMFAVGVIAMLLAGDPPEVLAVPLAGMVLSYSLAAQLDGSPLLAGMVILVATVLFKDIDDPRLGSSDIVVELVFLAMPFAAGRVVRRRERKAEQIAETADGRTRDAIRHERERIARELHDVIAHGMSVMVVQADAARHGVPEEDEETRAALAEIERAGRESLREMRRLLGLLRDPQEPEDASLEPQAGMRNLGGLIGSVRQAGLPVELRIEGDEYPLPPGVDLAGYRIIQEALTNSLRHAGGSRATVEVRYGPHGIDLRIADTGRGGPGAVNGSGNGLIGMRERARLYGGSFEAARTPEGFVVTASLPLETQP